MYKLQNSLGPTNYKVFSSPINTYSDKDRNIDDNRVLALEAMYYYYQ